MLLKWLSKSWKSLSGKCYLIHRIHQTLLLQTILFRSMQDRLTGHHFSSYEDIKNWINAFIKEKRRVLLTKWNPSAT